MGDNDDPEPSLFALHRIPNGLVVLIAVALLLQGPVGAFEALWGYTADLVGALFGGEELFWEVLCQTAPLAFAAGAITMAYRSGWMTFSSPASLVAASMLVMSGTWFGGELRSILAKKRSIVDADVNVIPISARGETRVLLSDQSLADQSLADLGALQIDPEAVEMDSAQLDSAELESISVAEAIAKLSKLQASATDTSHHRWTQRVPRVMLMPESSSAWGLVAKAINQLLGYFVVYRPRLFLAAILLGSYLGWSWQPYFESVRCWIDRNRTDPALASR